MGHWLWTLTHYLWTSQLDWCLWFPRSLQCEVSQWRDVSDHSTWVALQWLQWFVGSLRFEKLVHRVTNALYATPHQSDVHWRDVQTCNGSAHCQPCRWMDPNHSCQSQGSLPCPHLLTIFIHWDHRRNLLSQCTWLLSRRYCSRWDSSFGLGTCFPFQQPRDCGCQWVIGVLPIRISYEREFWNELVCPHFAEALENRLFLIIENLLTSVWIAPSQLHATCSRIGSLQLLSFDEGNSLVWVLSACSGYSVDWTLFEE